MPGEQGQVAHWSAAEAAAAREEWSKACTGYRRVLDQAPDHSGAWLGLSQALSRLNRHREARDAALSAHATHSTDPQTVFGIARRLRRFNEYAALVDCLGSPRLLAEAPERVLAEATLMLSSIGANTEARAMVETALRRFAGDASLQFIRGNLHAFDGRFDLAEADYEGSLISDPRLFQSSWMLAGLRTQRPDSHHVERLRSQLARAAQGRMGEVYVAFALHKELHDLGRHDEAWDALARGCDVKRKLLPYRPEASQTLFGELRRVCTGEFLARTVATRLDATPIFVVGMHRSGTTLLERILGGHSQVADAGESYAFAEQMKLATNCGTPGVLEAETVRRAPAADFESVAAGYNQAARWLARGRPFFTEKLPSNFLHAGFIARALPQARIVHMRRDPIATCFSNLRTLFSEAAPYSYDQRELADFYAGYESLMQHWRTVLPDRILDVSYDDLVRDPNGQAQRIAAFCGLPFEPGMLDLGRSGGSVVTASVADVRSGIRTDRDEAWKPYEQQLKPLISRLSARGVGRSPA